jgi:hypothetical protein
MLAGIDSRILPRVAIAAVAAVSWGCSSGPSAPNSLSPTAVPTLGATIAPTSTEPPQFVGTWLGVHNCQHIADMLHAAGMDSQILENVIGNGLLPGVDEPADVKDPAHPCMGAVEQPHSHFFTTSGVFGSRDMNDNQVDDGTWSIVDEDTFAINGTEFDYTITGNELRMNPVSVGSCPGDPNEWCQEAWKLMVAMPGMPWTRSP